LAAARTLRGAQTVAIVTGFYIIDAGAAETDGPPGALTLARALARLGTRTLLVTDEWCRPVLDHPALAPWTRDLSLMIVSPRSEDDWCRRHGVTHLVSVERPGRAADGHYYGARGQLLDERVEPFDAWFLEPPPGVVTVAVGDGGNEVGMGKVRDQVVRHVAGGERIGSIVPADHLVAAGLSNWGAYALVALLSHVSGTELLPTAAEEAALLEALVEAGAVDGLHGVRALQVDGQPLPVLEDMLRRLHLELAVAARQAG